MNWIFGVLSKWEALHKMIFSIEMSSIFCFRAFLNVSFGLIPKNESNACFFWEVIFLQCEECEVLAEIFEDAIRMVVS